MNKKIALYIIGILLLTTLVSAGYKTLFNPWTSRLDFVRDNNFSDSKLYLGETDVKNNLTVHGYVAVIPQLANMSMTNVTFRNVTDNNIYALNVTDVLSNTFKAYAFNGSILVKLNETSHYSMDYNTGSFYLTVTTYNRQNITLDYDRFYLQQNLSAGDLYVDNDAKINRDLLVIRNVSASWFNGRFNWTVISNWFTWDGTSLGLNTSAVNISLDERYLMIDNESLLNVNRSDYWDALGTINTSQMENNGGTLNILASWFSTMFNNFFGLKTTDNLAQGTVNFYDNQSWNESMARVIMDSKDLVINTSATSYTVQLNVSMGTYVDARDVITNNSATNYAVQLNASASAYADARDLIINTSATNYADGKFMPNSTHFSPNVLTNISCFNQYCTFFANATDACFYYVGGAKDCSGV